MAEGDTRSTHRAKGPLAARGGFELPLTNLIAAATLATTGPGRLSLGPRLPRRLVVVAAAGGGALATISLAKLLTAHRTAPASRPAEPAQAQPSQAASPAQAQQAQAEPG